MNELVNKAKSFSQHYHKGQLYGDGRDYFEAHIEPVVAKAVELAEKLGLNVSEVTILAYLHDVLEDCIQVTPKMIQGVFGDDILDSLLLLSSHIPSLDIPSKSLDDYLGSIGKAKSEVKIVKVADRTINVSALPRHLDETKKASLTKKYSDQLAYFKKYDIYPLLLSGSH